MSFTKLVFTKNATNDFGRFKIGDRAQGRFPQHLIDTYLRLGILKKVEEPIALDEPIKSYATKKTTAKKAQSELQN